MWRLQDLAKSADSSDWSAATASCGMTLRYDTTSVASIVVLGIALVASPAPAQPRIHPWCLVYQEMTGAWACSYDTFEQCRYNARSGNAGFCTANPAYREPAPLVRARRSRSR
jgi:hypothetical protein